MDNWLYLCKTMRCIYLVTPIIHWQCICHKTIHIVTYPCCTYIWGFINRHPRLVKLWWVGVGGFSKVVATFSHVGEGGGGGVSYNLFMATNGGCLNNPIFFNLGLCGKSLARFKCHHKFWPTSVSHRFFSLNSSLDFAGGKHQQKITIPTFRLILQNLLFRVLSLYSFL